MKTQIENFLLENGFTKTSENTYEQHVRRPGQIVVINGVRQETGMTESVFKFTYIGEGYEGSEEHHHKLTQWSLQVDDNFSPEFLVHDLEEFKEVFTK